MFTPTAFRPATCLVLVSLLISSARAAEWQEGEQTRFDDLEVTLSQPVLVARSKNYLWFPSVTRLSSGELLATMSDYADMHVSAATSRASWSSDGGLTWSVPQKALYGDGSLTLPGGDELFMPYYLRPLGDGVMGAPYQVCRRGERALRTVKPGVTIAGWPRPDKSFDAKLGLSGFVCNGQIVDVEGGYLATLYGYFENTDRYSLVASTSSDGVKWTVRSIIADENCKLPGNEGPCESALCRLKDGRLMCVFRMNAGKPYGQCFSSDDGRTWTEPAAMEGQFSVQPSLAVMQDGLVALSGGRPGLFLWLNPDGRAETWRKIDVLANHNRHRPQETIDAPGNTSSYTEVIPLDDTHLLYVYDRIPFSWNAIPADSPETNSVWAVRATVGRR